MGIVVVKGSLFAFGSQCDPEGRAVVLERLNVHQRDCRRLQILVLQIQKILVKTTKFSCKKLEKDG